MMQHKKAEMRKSLIGIIIVIIGAGIILFFMGVFSPLYGETIDKETCRASVNTRAAIIEQGFLAEAAITLPSLRCKTDYKCLSKEGNCEADYDKIKVNDDAEIKEEIAGLMYECWDMLGRGEKSFIGSWENGTLKNDKVCVICSVIDFDNNIKSQDRIDGLKEYLFETKVPGKNFTYLEFVSNNKNPELKWEGEDRISTKQKQSIVFIIGKTSSWENIGIGTLSGLIGTSGLIILIPGVGPLIGGAGILYTIGAGGAIGAGLGGIYDSEESTSLALVPYESEEITKYCEDFKSVI